MDIQLHTRVGWFSGECHCKIEKYIDEKNDTCWRVHCGKDRYVIGFKHQNEALKFIFRCGWKTIDDN